ncbi:VCBS repeat-containing protein [Lunatimonas salinarum]|uniref:VCBS repeat-containing protein n=1 Tax=Lunatimonas salinarum TaxID=1774590 RepID=UPI001FD76C46|nr:VCBS repeat-containing protein [Lunatimonas salinarum]
MSVTTRMRTLSAFLVLLVGVACQQEDPNALFTELSSKQTGISFRNLVRETEEFNVLTYGYFYQGGGVAIGDINNDGLPDIYFTGNMMASKLYLNKGNLEFEDITESAGVAAAGLWNTGVTMADVNEDGLLDIYICRSAANDPNRRRNVLLINNGDLTFTDRAKEFGLDDPGYSTQATFFDYDRDGDLDMFLLNHSTQEYAGFSRIDGSFKNRKGEYLGDKLFRNEGGKFVDVTQESGIINNVLGFGLAVTVTDVNDDGWPDIYVSNDYNEEDYLYINQQDGTFFESVREYFGHVSLFSMGADAADINNDGLVDLLTMDMMPEYTYNQKTILGPENYDKYRELLAKGFFPQTMRNMLHLNLGNGYFSEIGQYAGVSQTDWSWAALAADFDNDGWKDIFVANGYARNYLDMDFLNYMVSERIRSNQGANKEDALIELIEKMPPIYVENYLFHNNQDLTFTNRASEWGLKGLTVSNAAAYADLDGDGDLDLIVCHTNDPVSIYRNNSERLFERNYLKLRFVGNNQNTKGIGATVTAYQGDRLFKNELMPVRGYQSAVDQELLIGLGDVPSLDSLVVRWPTGEREILRSVAVNQILTMRQENARIEEVVPEKPKPVLAEVDGQLGFTFTHSESGILEFTQDRLMPNTLSALGPKMALGDVNGDGLDDIYVGGGKGQAGRLFIQRASGEFAASGQEVFGLDAAHIDTDAVFLDADSDGHLDLYVVSGGSDFVAGDALYRDRLYLNDGRGAFRRAPRQLPHLPGSGGTVGAADLDGDGLADLVIGGRYVPGSFPLVPDSYLLRNLGNGAFEDITQSFAAALGQAGLIADLQLVDLNGDQWMDLVLVGEWMEPKVFMNNGGKGLALQANVFDIDLSGWWLSITAADLNGDGHQDLILGNFGDNNPFNPSTEQPMRLIYKDFDGNGSVDPIFTYYIADTSTFAYSRDELVGQLPFLKGRFTDYRSFAKQDIGGFFTTEEMEGADTLRVVTLQSVVLINDGNASFKVKPLPKEAQFSPLYAVEVVDVNGDGALDLLSGGNLAKSRVSMGQQDANPGFIFLGDGSGSFSLRSPSLGQLAVKGDIRDIRHLSLDGEDYFIYLRNNGSVKVYRLSR